MKKTVNYQKLRGFNYTQPDAVSDRAFWADYHHDIVDRDMGYAERLRLNSARIFLSYDFYKENPDRFLANVKDFVQTAWKHGITTNPIIFMGFRFREDEIPAGGGSVLLDGGSVHGENPLRCDGVTAIRAHWGPASGRTVWPVR